MAQIVRSALVVCASAIVCVIAPLSIAESRSVAQMIVKAKPAGGKNFYVSPEGNDSNDGSQHRPWATISHAGSVATPGSTVHVAPGVYHEELWSLPGGAVRPIHFFDLEDETVWGATARMLRELLDRIWRVIQRP
jgi:hypothetical protein